MLIIISSNIWHDNCLDAARVLCRFNDIILARVFAHQDVEELAKESSVPGSSNRSCDLTNIECNFISVINALSDKYHPLQTLADLMTVKEHFGNLKGLTLAWAGDGNNVLHDLAIGAIKSGMNVRIATPKGYEPDADVMATARKLAEENNVQLFMTNDPKLAVKDANIVVTDTWVSMGQESEAKQKKIDFTGYQVDNILMKIANPNAVFLHCLPRKPEEVSDEVKSYSVCYRFLFYRLYHVGVLFGQISSFP